MSTISPDITSNVLGDVQVERERQDAKFGQQDHDSTVWLTVLGEEVGELAETMLREREWLRPTTHHIEVKEREIARAQIDMRAEAIQVAAVAVALVEWIDRGMPVVPQPLDERLDAD